MGEPTTIVLTGLTVEFALTDAPLIQYGHVWRKPVQARIEYQRTTAGWMVGNVWLIDSQSDPIEATWGVTRLEADRAPEWLRTMVEANFPEGQRGHFQLGLGK